MDIKQLETFITVCKRKSFSIAAKELYITQPTVTNHIQALEDELKASLIVRASRNISLTPQGELLYAFAVKTISEKQRLNDAISELSGNFGGLIEVATSTVPETLLIPKLIKKFNKAYPEVTFRVRHLDSATVIEELESKNYSIGFSGFKKTGSFLKYYKIAQDRMVVIEGKDSGFINKDTPTIRAEDIKNLPLISREEGSGSKSFVFRNLINKKNMNVVAEVDSNHLIKQMVAENIGISIISIRSITEAEKEQFHIYELAEGRLERDLYLVLNPNMNLSIIEARFKELCLHEGEK